MFIDDFVISVFHDFLSMDAGSICMCEKNNAQAADTTGDVRIVVATHL